MKKINEFLFGSTNYDLDAVVNELFQKTRKNRWKLFLILFVSALFTVVMVSNVRTINKQLINVRNLEKKQNELINNNKVLTKRIADLESPERIIKISSEKLNMIPNHNIPKKMKLYKQK